MNRFVLGLALTLVSTAPRIALADGPVNVVVEVMPAPPPPPPGQYAPPPPQEQYAPQPPPPVEMPAPPRRENPCGGAFALRTALVGTYFKMADVSTFGGGIDVAVGGGRCQRWDVLADFRFVQATTPGGLDVHQVSVNAVFELAISSGIRAGAGFGFEDTGVRRATSTHEWTEGGGVGGVLRLGYDTGLRLRPIVLLDVRAAVANTNTTGVGLQLGVRF